MANEEILKYWIKYDIPNNLVNFRLQRRWHRERLDLIDKITDSGGYNSES